MSSPSDRDGGGAATKSEPKLISESEPLPLGEESDRFWCAKLSQELAARAGLDARAGHEVSLVVAELVANAVRHGGGGAIVFRVLDVGLEVELIDRGPGFDLEQAFVDGYSRGRQRVPGETVPGETLGIGLGAARRLMSELEVSVSERGTRVRARRYRKPRR
jgi:serine/threonine-protein kinase RsbT